MFFIFSTAFYLVQRASHKTQIPSIVLFFAGIEGYVGRKIREKTDKTNGIVILVIILCLAILFFSEFEKTKTVSSSIIGLLFGGAMGFSIKNFEMIGSADEIMKK
jgi:formate hydrogenlyase subunit 3/multisubunit Na+/H+ antiporter MnhD subunit